MKASVRYPVLVRTLPPRKRIAGALGIVLLSGAGTSCQSVTALRHEAVPLDEYPRHEYLEDGDEYPEDEYPRAIETPVKVHLLDGSTVLFPEGAGIGDDRLTGIGERYDIRLSPLGTVSEVARDSVSAMERFDTEVDPDRTMKYNLIPGLVLVVGFAVAGLALR